MLSDHTLEPTGVGVIAQPLYRQVRDQITREIERGVWAPGQTLPNEGQLGRRYGVSVGTIRRAVEEIEQSGLVARHQGRGTIVAALDRLASSKNGVVAFRGKMQPEPLNFVTISKSARKATAQEARILRLGSGDIVHEVLQAGFLEKDGKPRAVMCRQRLVVSQRRLGGNMLPESISADRFDWYRSITRTPVCRIETTFEIVRADAALQDMMGLERDSQVLEIQRVALMSDGSSIELLTIEGRPGELQLCTSSKQI